MVWRYRYKYRTGYIREVNVTKLSTKETNRAFLGDTRNCELVIFS